MTRRSPVEAPSLSTSVKGSPVRLSASSCGLAIVALVSTKRIATVQHRHPPEPP